MRVVLTSVLFLVSTTAIAQMPCAGMQTRPIKALSEQQISDLNAGRGMGLALAAELNGYPGRSHVLELADELELSSDQGTQVQALFASMKAEAQPLGSKLIAQEMELDKLFASRAITPDTLKASTAAIAVTNGELRETHLRYHLDCGNPDAGPDAALCRIAGIPDRPAAASAPPLALPTFAEPMFHLEG